MQFFCFLSLFFIFWQNAHLYESRKKMSYFLMDSVVMRIINKGLPCEHYVMTTASRLHLPPAPVLLQSSFNSNTITDRGNLKPLSQSMQEY
jgi:hypothetical protein